MTPGPQGPRLPARVDLPLLTPAQERIIAVARDAPGLTIREMALRVGVSHATMTYHLGLLSRKGLLSRERDGREVRHYPMGLERRKLAIEALCRDPRKRQVFDFLAAQPIAMSIHRMATALGLPFGYLKRTLVQFEKQGLVQLHRARFRYVVHTAPGLHRVSLQAVGPELQPAPQILLSE